MIFHQIKSILIKDFLIEYSYKGRFIYSILFIFMQLVIFYFLSSYLEASYTRNEDSPTTNLFGFFILGICFLDISYTLISYVSIRIEEYKKIGVFEELFILPVNPITFILMSNIYPIFFSLFKFFVYIAFVSILFNIQIHGFINLFILILVLLFALITFMALSLLASSFAILYYRGSYISMVHNTISVLFGGVLYPASFIYEKLFFLELFIPLHSILDLVRYAFDVHDMSRFDIMQNIFLVIIHSIVFSLIGIISVKYALRKAFDEGRISLY